MTMPTEESMRLRKTFNLRLLAASVSVLAAALVSVDARSDAPPRQVTPNPDAGGFASVYGQLPPSQAEFLSTPDSIKNAAATGAPSLVWEVLEHGEKVECLDCIPVVAPLLYAGDARTREIAAWWLRRRIFGVFGAGQVYAATIQTLQSDPDATRRSYAAYALGEFFAPPGVAACAAALGDKDAGVRAAAASALGRLNSDGNGALSTALSDSDPGVKLAALSAAVRINSFVGIANVAALTADPTADVRRRALEVLDALDSKDTVAAVSAVAQSDPDATVRAEACHALGTFGDPSALAALQQLAAQDPDTFVRDEAQIALQRL
jgi:HEAT repeat protein